MKSGVIKVLHNPPAWRGNYAPLHSNGVLAVKPAAHLAAIVCCSGGGGLALGLEQAGFTPRVLIDVQPVACNTLRANRPDWDVRQMNIRDLDLMEEGVYGIDLLAAGLPRLKSAATGSSKPDTEVEESLVRWVTSLVRKLRPKALLIDNVPSLVMGGAYATLRSDIELDLSSAGYSFRWMVVDAADFGVPQVRKHGLLIALQGASIDELNLAAPPNAERSQTVGSVLRESMEARGWPGAQEWAQQAYVLAPTLVGGSWRRGGADLGPAGSKRAWARMGVDGATVGDFVPAQEFELDPTLGRSGMVKLTVEQVATLQGFPSNWHFAGRKTARYRQVANAMPPPLARAIGVAIADQLNHPVARR